MAYHPWHRSEPAEGDIPLKLKYRTHGWGTHGHQRSHAGNGAKKRPDVSTAVITSREYRDMRNRDRRQTTENKMVLVLGPSMKKRWIRAIDLGMAEKPKSPAEETAT